MTRRLVITMTNGDVTRVDGISPEFSLNRLDPRGSLIIEGRNGRVWLNLRHAVKAKIVDDEESPSEPDDR